MTRDEWLDLYRRRQAVCSDCTHNVMGMCTQCGCIAKMKATLATAKCPRDFWPLPQENNS
jgi:hypothetical protein